MKKIVALITCFLILTSLGGCALLKLREDVKISQDSCLLFGEVISKSPLKKPIIVVAYSNTNGQIQIADYAVLAEPGQFELLVQEGRYEIFAFEDGNASLSPDQSEWMGLRKAR